MGSLQRPCPSAWLYFRCDRVRSTAMPSPFPGMNPYLEQDSVWPDVHHWLIIAFAKQLVPRVRPGYIVTIGQDVYLHVDSDTERLHPRKPDVSIVTASAGSTATAAADSAVAA